MRCLGRARIAEVASLDAYDPELAPHLGECIACRRELETQRAMRAMLRRMPVPALPNARREELAAELFAIAEREHARPPRWPSISASGAIGGAVATLAAAAAVVALTWNVREPDSSVTAQHSTDEEPTLSTRIVAHDDPSPVLAAPRIAANDGAQLVRRTGDDRDTLTLIDGIVEIDTRDTRAVDVRVGDSTVRVDDASVRIRARGRAIVSVQVVVGSAHVVAPDRTMTLARDSVWLAEPPATQRAVTAFRDAWIAFRAGRHDDAIALFDRATDPAVAEEAAYWAAIAAERAGDRTDAARRLRDFLARFPESAYADQARAALAH